VVGKLIIAEDSAWNNVISHLQKFRVRLRFQRNSLFQESGHGLRSGSIA